MALLAGDFVRLGADRAKSREEVEEVAVGAPCQACQWANAPLDCWLDWSSCWIGPFGPEDSMLDSGISLNFILGLASPLWTQTAGNSRRQTVDNGMVPDL